MTRKEVINTIEQVRTECVAMGRADLDASLTRVLDAFESMRSTAASIMGSKGGNTPVKLGSRPRGRPKKGAKE